MAGTQTTRLTRMNVYHVEVEVERDEALRYAWEWLEERRDLPRLVVVPVNASIGHCRVLTAITSRIRWVTQRTLIKAGNLRGAAVLVVWPARETLHFIQEKRPADVLVVPWRTEESDAWLRAHSSKSLLGGPELKPPTINDPVVRAAMESLTNFTNLRNALVQSEDRDEAIRTVRVLVKYGRAVNPDELYEWALAHGWPGGGAARLKAFAEEIMAGRRHQLRTPGRDYGAEHIAYWKEKAAGR